MDNQARPVYFNNLDGLRAVAALTVILAHIVYYFDAPNTGIFSFLKGLVSNYGRGGNLGVNFFFLISGFLITYLMYVERSKNGKINVYHFYVRRVLRIWPLYFMTLFIGFFLYPLLLKYFTGYTYDEKANLFLFSVFASNFDLIYNGHATSGILDVQWSVAVEEQFYVLWPLLFALLSRSKLFIYFLFILIVISEYFYSIKGFYFPEWEYHSICCLRYLSFGALMAVLCYHRTEAVYSFFSKLNKYAIAGIYLFCIVLILFKSKFSSIEWMYYIYDGILMVFLGFIIIEQNFSSNSFYKISAIPGLNWLGKISYGLYLTHMIAITLVMDLFPADTDLVVWKALTVVLLTVIISHFSYYYFESFFLSLKRKFASS